MHGQRHAAHVAEIIADLVIDREGVDRGSIASRIEKYRASELAALASYLQPYVSFCGRHRRTGLPAINTNIIDYLNDTSVDAPYTTITERHLAAVAVAHCLLGDRPTTQRRLFSALPAILKSNLALPGKPKASNIWACWQNRLAEPKSAEQIFSIVYNRQVWGHLSGNSYFSGVGSHRADIVLPYLDAVGSFISNLAPNLIAVDLGCGDFNIGKSLVHLFSSYIACDVVSDLLDDNRHAYANLNVDFRYVDITTDELPHGDVVFLRQVLQHLSNNDIKKVLPKLSRYKYMILSEHVPSFPFQENIDKPTNHDVRADFGSGVVLTIDPFALRPVSEKILCCTPEHIGVIKTIAYQLR